MMPHLALVAGSLLAVTAVVGQTQSTIQTPASAQANASQQSQITWAQATPVLEAAAKTSGHDDEKFRQRVQSDLFDLDRDYHNGPVLIRLPNSEYYPVAFWGPI